MEKILKTISLYVFNSEAEKNLYGYPEDCRRNFKWVNTSVQVKVQSFSCEIIKDIEVQG